MVLAHFRLDERIGRGGMGEVWRATDLALDRPVALKVLPAAVARDPDRRERLLREARAQARLAHPNVCHIYYVGQDRGVVFFAMELVVGESLAERLARGPVPPDEAVELVRQAALGLRAAARHGFLHRDVKPSNLMVDREGRVKVVDFGLVRAIDGAEAPPEAAEPAGAPTATAMVGTPHYMAPEQASGAAIDARADIYALGATLHHLVSGRPPFDGETLDELVTQHRAAAPPRLRAAGPRRERRVASSLDAVIAKMMAKRPEERFADHDQLLAELARVSPARSRPAAMLARVVAALIDVMVVAIALVPPQLVSIGWLDAIVQHEAFAVTVGVAYATVAVSRWGTTVGRWLLELEVVEVATGGRPPPRRALARAAVEYGPLWAGTCLSALHDVAGARVIGDAAAVLVVGGIVWGVAALAHAAWFTIDRRAAWDRASGTMVRYRGRGPAGAGGVVASEA